MDLTGKTCEATHHVTSSHPLTENFILLLHPLGQGLKLVAPVDSTLHLLLQLPTLFKQLLKRAFQLDLGAEAKIYVHMRTV